METRRGASGALITVNGDVTTKLDVERTGRRVREQGIWLTQFPKVVALPRVIAVHDDGYDMETLEVPNLLDLAVNQTCCRILRALESDIWDCEVTYWFESVWENFEKTHMKYLRDLLKDSQPTKSFAASLIQLFNAVDWLTLRTGVTHGDGIIDNVAYRKNDLVLLDPIPPSGAIPQLRCVDVGRVIQSAIGYERVRYDLPNTITSVISQVNLILNEYMWEKFDLNEARASLYWAQFHMLRGVRTAPLTRPGSGVPGSGVRNDLLQLTYTLQKVANSWMR